MLRKLALGLSAALFSLAGAANSAVFRYAYRIDPASLDPHSIGETFTLSFLGQIYEPLVGRGKKLELIPALAVKWEQPDPLTWRFHLRPNVKFHGGEPFSADDVVYSIMRAKSSDMGFSVISVKEAKKVDDLTVDFIMEKPNPSLLFEITS
ncbi:MAG TPA: ABC transporter substrate-binding protein, partial [Hyphomicrobiales bacterium]|nr:ABC transporter substrate-binding protein [Hyphomicrobiales bacterium]